jgi:hypothetical protein
MRIARNDVLFYLSLILAIWFACAGMVWTYFAALVIAYPFGIISFILWRMIRKEGRKRTKVIPMVLTTGLILSMAVLVFLLIWN